MSFIFTICSVLQLLQTGFASRKIWTVLKSSGKLAVIWKNPDSFEIIWKIGSHLEKSGLF